jgi:hypothetical protein
MTSSLPDLNIAKTPIYESLVATRGDPYQVDRPARGWSLPAVSTDLGAANDILGRLLAQGGSDGQGWVAVVLVGGPAAAQLSQQLAQGTMAGLPGPFSGGYNPLAAYQALQAIQTMQAMQALQNQGQPWSQAELPYPVTAQLALPPGGPSPMAAPPPAPLAFEAGPSGYQPGYDYQSYGDTGTVPAVAEDHIAASMASNMAAGIVQNALRASSPSGFMYDQYANQPRSQPDPYAASALTPAPAYPGATQANPLDSSGHYPVVPQPEMGMGGIGMGMAADPAGQYATMQAQMQAQAQLETNGQYPVMPMMGQPDMGMMPGAVAGVAPGLAPAMPYGAIPPGAPASALPPGVDMSEWINAANAAALQEIQAAQSDDDGPGPHDPTPTMTFPPGTVPMMLGTYPGYPGATYAAMGRPDGGREREEDSANGRFGRFASAVRELRRR